MEKWHSKHASVVGDLHNWRYKNEGGRERLGS